MSYPANKKRNTELIRIKENNPEMSWAEIGNIFKINRQTAYKIWLRVKRPKDKNSSLKKESVD